jgi:glycosyltransferase involved in cell wall biosynthesis
MDNVIEPPVTNIEGGLRTKGIVKKSDHQQPLISIITVVYNGARYLEQTIVSIINQSYKNIEYIIIDGGSTDSSLDIIRKYESNIDYWVSEPDNGMYDAIHKGFALSTGEILAWLNADDIYFPYTLSIVAQTFTMYQHVQWITGIPTHMNSKSEVLNVEHQKTYFQLFLKMGLYRGDKLGFIQQESTFFKRDLYFKSPLNISLNLAGDFELWINFSKYTALYTVKTILSSFRIHENQKSNNIKAYYDECNRVKKNYIPKCFKYLIMPISILSLKNKIKPLNWLNKRKP